MSYEYLLPPSWKQQVGSWLAEDTPSFDYGGYIVGEVLREAFLFGKGSQPAVLAGSPFADEIFAHLDCKSVCLFSFLLLQLFKSFIRVEWHVKEGDTFEPVKHIATVKGKARFLLLGERVALNLLARCSGIATKSFNDSLFDLSLIIVFQVEKDERSGKKLRVQRYHSRNSKDNSWYVFMKDIPEMSVFDPSW